MKNLNLFLEIRKGGAKTKPSISKGRPSEKLEDEDTSYNCIKRIKALTYQDFCYYSAKAGIILNETFRSKQLENINEKEFNSLIIVFS